MKQLLKVIFIGIAVSLVFSVHGSVLAENTPIEHNTPSDPVYEAKNGLYKNEDAHYFLDVVSPDELEGEGFFDDLWDSVSIDIGDKIQYSLFLLTDGIFGMNFLLTNVMLGILDFAYDSNILNKLIEGIEGNIVAMTGITGNTFGPNGLYGGFLGGVIVAVIAIYTLYQYFVKKASISSFSGLLASLISLTLALVFFSNYGPIIKGANALSIEASALVLSGDINLSADEDDAPVNVTVDQNDGSITSTNLQEKMYDNIFDLMIHNPYLMLQYGTANQSDIGADRVLSLLKAKAYSEDRSEIAIKEVKDYGNDTLTYPNITKRLNFVALMTITNFISSIPIYMLSVSLILFQFWFLIIAMVAPFAFMWSALPNQFGVLKRYFLELSIPLALKIAVSIFALVIFSLSQVLQAINALSNGSAMGLFLTSLIQALILLALFILRKRIFSIFSKGSELLGNVRAEMDNAFVNPMKKGVQNVATVGGAVVGGALAGPQGAMLGSSIGNNMAGALTGNMEPGDMARNAAMTMLAADRLKKKSNDPKPSLEGSKEAPTLDQGDNNDLFGGSTSLDTAYFLSDQGLTSEMVDKTLDSLDKSGLNDLSKEEMKETYDNILLRSQQGNMKEDFATSFSKGIATSRKRKNLENEQKIINKGSSENKRYSLNDFLNDDDVPVPNDNDVPFFPNDNDVPNNFPLEGTNE